MPLLGLCSPPLFFDQTVALYLPFNTGFPTSQPSALSAFPSLLPAGLFPSPERQWQYVRERLLRQNFQQPFLCNPCENTLSLLRISSSNTRRHFKFILGSCHLPGPPLALRTVTGTRPCGSQTPRGHPGAVPLPPGHSQSGAVSCIFFPINISHIIMFLFWIKIKERKKKLEDIIILLL